MNFEIGDIITGKISGHSYRILDISPRGDKLALLNILHNGKSVGTPHNYVLKTRAKKQNHPLTLIFK
jgi:hypothetical protein